jgi:holo-[acyl-carrier protein] synthase
MIIGTGIDIVEVERIEKAIKRSGDDFLKRIFTSREVDYAKTKKLSAMHLAGRFAAKEAVLKAFSRGQFNFKDIEVLNDDVGRPFCRLNKNGFSVQISISHTEKYALASAVVEKTSKFA